MAGETEKAENCIKKRKGLHLMKKIERLELENKVLKNIIACIQEELNSSEHSYSEQTGTIMAIINFEEKMKIAEILEEAIDYRKNKNDSPAAGTARKSST